MTNKEIPQALIDFLDNRTRYYSSAKEMFNTFNKDTVNFFMHINDNDYLSRNITPAQFHDILKNIMQYRSFKPIVASILRNPNVPSEFIDVVVSEKFAFEDENLFRNAFSRSDLSKDTMLKIIKKESPGNVGITCSAMDVSSEFAKTIIDTFSDKEMEEADYLPYAHISNDSKAILSIQKNMEYHDCGESPCIEDEKYYSIVAGNVKLPLSVREKAFDIGSGIGNFKNIPPSRLVGIFDSYVSSYFYNDDMLDDSLKAYIAEGIDAMLCYNPVLYQGKDKAMEDACVNFLEEYKDNPFYNRYSNYKLPHFCAEVAKNSHNKNIQAKLVDAVKQLDIGADTLLALLHNKYLNTDVAEYIMDLVCTSEEHKINTFFDIKSTSEVVVTGFSQEMFDKYRETFNKNMLSRYAVVGMLVNKGGYQFASVHILPNITEDEMSSLLPIKRIMEAFKEETKGTDYEFDYDRGSDPFARWYAYASAHNGLLNDYYVENLATFGDAETYCCGYRPQGLIDKAKEIFSNPEKYGLSRSSCALVLDRIDKDFAYNDFIKNNEKVFDDSKTTISIYDLSLNKIAKLSPEEQISLAHQLYEANPTNVSGYKDFIDDKLEKTANANDNTYWATYDETSLVPLIYSIKNFYVAISEDCEIETNKVEDRTRKTEDIEL